MQFVEDHALERAEQIGRVGGGKQQRQLLRRGQQNLRRIAALALALGGRRVAGARLDADRQPHLGDRRFQVARDIDGQRLERRDVERVQTALAAHPAAGGDELALLLPRSRSDERGERNGTAAQLHQARQKSGERLAAAGRRDQQHRAAGARLGQQFELVRARRPAAAGEPARERFRQNVRCVRERSRARISGRQACGRGLRDHDQAVDRHALLAAHRRLWRDAPPQGRRRRALCGCRPRHAHSAASAKASCRRRHGFRP